MSESYNNINQTAKVILEASQESLSEIGALIRDAYKSNLQPHVRTGRLIASPTYDVKEGSVIVGSDVEYAPFLEYGTSKMRAHPCLRPAVDANKDAIPNIMKKNIQEKI